MGAAASRDGPLLTFLQNSASAALQEEYALAAQQNLDSLLPPPKDTSWIVVEQSNDRVVVDIPIDRSRNGGLPVPFLSTRLQLEWQSDRWCLCDVLEQCMRCNLIDSHKIGACQICKGTGKQLEFLMNDRSWLRWLRNRLAPQDQPCEFCDGTGKCLECADERYPGWVRALMLRARQFDI